MTREHKLPAGPRPANQSPTRSRQPGREIPSPTTRLHTKPSPSGGAPMLSASSQNNLPLFSFARNGDAISPGPVEQDPSSQYDFLPSVSFDDLQSSIESASGDFKLAQFPSPTGEGSILDSQGPGDVHFGDTPILSQNGGMTRAAPQPGKQQTLPNRSRAGSLLRSAPHRQSSTSSTASTMSAASEAPRGTATIRPRRQSQYPPVSNSNIGKGPPRKAPGAGVLDPSAFPNDSSVYRRPSLVSNMERNGQDPSRSSIDAGGHNLDSYQNMTTSRAAKVKTLSQPPPPRYSQTNTPADNSTLSVDQNRASALFPPSPRGSRQAPGTPGTGGSKRMSMMPSQHPLHATGLGARTVSPTDAQRMKRLSVMPISGNNPIVSANNSILVEPLPPPPPNDPRPSSRSPSMLPRKTSTPSSQRTTPDPNRKSYSSGFSVGSTTSYNTVRTSTGSLQPRVPQSGTSRLPAPKSLSSLPVSSQDEDQDVPPVPAIPKVYESPKDSPEQQQYFDKRKSALAHDESSIRSSSTGSLSGAPVQEPARVQRKESTRTGMQNRNLEQEKKSQPAQPRRTFRSMNLPPLTVGPLSAPTVNKIARLQHDQDPTGRNLGSPPARQMAKTPTTPLTASKSTFFSKNRVDKELASFRSKSSINRSQVESPLVVDSSTPDSVDESMNKSSVSPYLSSSVPKETGFEHANFKRSQTGPEIRDTEEGTSNPVVPQKPSGPRAQAQPSKSTPKPPTKAAPASPVQQDDPEEPEPPTPSSMTNLRRKLSLSWKRSNSKAASHAQDKASDNQGTRHDAMPPPRIPVSATTGDVASKTGSPGMAPKSSSSYLDSKRRKTSASGLNAAMSHERKRSDVSQGVSGQAAKNNGDGAGNRAAVSHTSSVMHKFLRSKPSTTSVRHTNSWTADLDKDDLIAEEEMKKLGSRRKETELAAKTLDALLKRATPKERVSAQDAIRIAMLNIYERGEIIDYNDVYFCGTQNAQKVVGDLNTEVPNFGYDDERGDYTIVTGDHLAFRYEIIDVLGKGSFGQVVRCIDHKTGSLVAVKIIRNKKRFHQQALVEVNILQKLREWDPNNKHSMVNFTHSFYFRGHLCISTELLDMNLYEFIKANAFRGFSIKMIRRFTKQMLSSLNLLKQHKVIHCDLKPENILVRHPLHTEIKVIDFGSSCFENEKVYTYIQSRFYRSPEVILGMSYGMPIDMWSLGCILAELYTGVPIFPGENEQEQLACIMEVFGPPEKHLIEKSTRKKLFFDSMGKPRLTVSSKGRRRRPSSKTLQQVLKCEDEPFLDFIARCLRWDPDRRMKPEEAIRHEFITGQKTSVPLPRVATREQSPIKRHNTISTPRPLPEPPAAAAPLRVTSTIRPKDATNMLGTPAKTGTVIPPMGRRVSGAPGGPPKRTSTGTGGISSGPLGSNLPRAAGRTASSKQDLASLGATAAMSRRAGA